MRSRTCEKEGEREKERESRDTAASFRAPSARAMFSRREIAGIYRNNKTRMSLTKFASDSSVTRGQTGGRMGEGGKSSGDLTVAFIRRPIQQTRVTSLFSAVVRFIYPSRC